MIQNVHLLDLAAYLYIVSGFLLDQLNLVHLNKLKSITSNKYCTAQLW